MTDHQYQLVHANLARMRAPWDDPIMAGFLARMDEIDALALETEGFVSQPTFPDEGIVYSEPDLLNLSVCSSVEALEAFTYRGEHASVMDQRAEWFEQTDGPNYVLYWAPTGQTPTEAEVKRRIEHLAKHGPTPFAFTFEQNYSVDEILDFEPLE